ncbi:MAG: MaoC family dehydratase [Thermoplasmatota archaeon]
MPGRTWDELVPGLILRHPENIRVTQEDNAAFCRLTHNRQPLHLDEEFAKTTSWGRILVNGLYTMSLAVGVSVEETTAGTLVGNLGYEAVEHPAPVHPGDTLHFETEVVDRRPTKRAGRGLATLEHRAYNEAGVLVCRLRRIVLVQGGP